MTQWLPVDYLNDFLAFCVSSSLLFGYQLRLHGLARREFQAVLSQVAADARSAWVASIVATPDSGLPEG